VVKPASNGLPPEEIIKRIKKALMIGGDTHSWDDVREGLIEGKYQIFWNDHGACISEVIDAPKRRYMNIFVVAGELPGVMDLQDEVENHAITMGCSYMMTSARMGWKKVLPGYGWKESRAVFVREIQGF